MVINSADASPGRNGLIIPPRDILALAGRPAHVDHYKTFTIMVWNCNLLADLGGPPVAIAWRHPLTRRIVCRSGVPAFRTLAE